MHRGPLIPVVSLAAGITLSKIVELPWWFGAIFIVPAIALYAYILTASNNPVAAFKWGKWHILWVILLFLGIGVTDESLSRPISLEKSYDGIVPASIYCEVTGVLTKTYGERIDVKIDGTNGAKARIRTGVKEVSPGDIIRIPSNRLKEVASDTTEIGRKIMPMMKASGILYSGSIMPKYIEVVGKSNNLRYFFAGIRERIETKIERSHLSKPTSDFLNAILMGDKNGLNEKQRLTFAHGGMAHMLALSGLHIGILASFLLLIMWPIKLLGHYKWGYMLALVLLWFYVAVTGMAYSSVRACIMTTFAFIGIIAERKNFAGNALFSACLLILIIDPGALFNAGFQLSVVCVGSLIAFATQLNPIGHRSHPKLFVICGALITTMIATGASWVLTSYYFSQVPLMFLPANFVLLPLLPIYLSFAVVFVAALCLGFEIGWIGSILDLGYAGLLKSVEWLSCGTEFVVDYQIPLWGVLFWMLLLSLGAYIVNRKDLKKVMN
ncbi:MAG: ComEC/Rec2 family competence protein [Muribaculaceae bacterium]|nr:ComEC/Rec2 family competence protein [Muribaculaceae bacterium]